MAATVLVVDDSTSMRQMISQIVQNCGLKVVEAVSGEDACRLFPEGAADLVLLDVNMGGIDGFETCRRLRAMSAHWFPVIYLSASDSVESYVEGLDAGGDAYVTKPVNPRILEAIVKAMARIAEVQTRLDRANRQLERMARLDSLTSVANRRAFDETLVRFLLHAKREENTTSLLMIDVDFFKAFNDHYGHQAGDQCLIAVASALQSSVLRPSDFVARYGGEEFAVLLPETDHEGARQVAERIMQSLENDSIPHAASPFNRVTVSIGVAVASAGRLSPDDFIETADKQLYVAKEAGRNQARLA